MSQQKLKSRRIGIVLVEMEFLLGQIPVGISTGLSLVETPIGVPTRTISNPPGF